MAALDTSIESLQLVTDIVASGGDQLQRLLQAPRESKRYLSELLFLRNILLEGASTAEELYNAAVPINRLPPELLVRIFSLTPTVVPVRAQFPVIWPYHIYKLQDLKPLLLVCRRWRDVALANPGLWANLSLTDLQSRHVRERASTTLLSIHIHSVFHRTTDVTACIWTCASRIRQLHLDADIPRLERVHAGSLEHCKIAGPLQHCVRGQLETFLCCHSERLKSLYLDQIHCYVPQARFPALTRFAVVGMYAKYPTWTTSGWWNIDDLVSFLAGSPLLEELYVLGADIHRSAESRDRVNGQRTVAQPQTVALGRLRRLAFDAYGEQSIISAIRRVTSAIIVPPSCHRYCAPLRTSGEDSIAALLECLQGDQHYTRMRLDCSGRNLMQLVGETGSVSFLPSVTCAEDWKELLALLSSSPLFARIEELSLCLYKHDYPRIAGLQPILSGFPNVKTLVITYPTTLVLSLFTTVPPVLQSHLEGILAPLIPEGDGTAPSCPLLETLCIYIPRYLTSVDYLHRVLYARQRTRPIRRLIVGYDPALELDMLADVFALENWVEEFVCEEVRLPAWISSDWVLDVPAAYQHVHTNWPLWSENPR
ncbi:hypothetical protein C8Q76DRAFT_862323 [Earliella scabrosa]|nr:hypothetical protein C8Q76DRAFT_862323 [Earliella scabrosa]